MSEWPKEAALKAARCQKPRGFESLRLRQGLREPNGMSSSLAGDNRASNARVQAVVRWPSPCRGVVGAAFLTHESDGSCRGHTPEKLTRLFWRDCAQISCFTSGDPTVRFDIGENHLFLLNRVEAAHTDVCRMLIQRPVNGRCEMITAARPLPRASTNPSSTMRPSAARD